MAKSETSSSGQCPTSSGVAWKVIVAIVLLRLCIGWHFLSEGAKKLSYDRGSDSWSINVPTAAMLGQAKGPLAGFIQHQLPGGHGWQSLLAVPQEMTPEAGQQLNDWVAEYVKRRQAELSKGEHKPVEIPDFAPYANWYEQIIADWKAIHTSFTKVSGLKKEQLAEAATLLKFASSSWRTILPRSRLISKLISTSCGDLHKLLRRVKTELLSSKNGLRTKRPKSGVHLSSGLLASVSCKQVILMSCAGYSPTSNAIQP